MIEKVGKSPTRRTVTVVLFLTLLAALLALGTWQVERLHWKEALLADIEARRTAPPITVAEADALVRAGKSVDYTAITATGRLDHAHEQYFLATSDGEPGFHVYTPLMLPDGKTVLVNRGFVPERLKDPRTRPEGQVGSDVQITGLARDKLFAKPSWVVPENDVGKGLYFWKDMDAMASKAEIAPAKLLPFFIDAGPAVNPGGYPKGGVTQIDLPNNHLSYAVTWYGLAAALVIIAGLAYFRRAK